MSQREFDYAVGGLPQNVAIGFYALTVQVDNPTNQWVSLGNTIFIPQYTVGAIYPLVGTDAAVFSFTAPPGATQPPTIAGQFAVITYHDLSFAPSAGVGMLGGRAPYYDRNPLSKVFKTFIANQGPQGETVQWTYTVPAGRRTYVELTQTFLALETAGDAAVTANAGRAECYIRLTPSGGNPLLFKTYCASHVQGLAPARSRGDAMVGTSIEMQTGDQLDGMSNNLYTATVVTLYVAAKLTEFDV